MLLVLSLYVEAQTLQEVINQSIQNNYQLQILEEESAIAGEQSEIESHWADPILKVGINDIQLFDKPFNRDIEAMQNQFIAVSQTIPLSNKLKISSGIEREKQQIIEEKKEVLKVNIAFGIRKAFIEAKEAEKNLVILDEYIRFLQTPLNLLINLSAIEKNMIERYIQTELMQKNYQLQRESWLEKIAVAKERIALIGNLNINSFSEEVILKNYHLQSSDKLLMQLLSQSPELRVISKLKELSRQNIALAEAKTQADITVSTGYYQRFDRNDYVSVAVSYPLYVHGKQAQQKVQALKRSTIQNISYERTKVQLEQGLKITLHQLKSLYAELKILERSEIKINRLIANAKINITSGGSLIHYYELFTKRVNNQLLMRKKQREVALNENQIDQLLGVI